jgi:hypothetical protein
VFEVLMLLGGQMPPFSLETHNLPDTIQITDDDGETFRLEIVKGE